MIFIITITLVDFKNKKTFQISALIIIMIKELYINKFMFIYFNKEFLSSEINLKVFLSKK